MIRNIAAIAIATVWMAQPAHAAAPVVFAAASTAEVVNDLAAAYAGSTGKRFRPVFASSGSLARQIEDGAPADVFISANLKWVSYLTERKLAAADTRRTLFRNRLVVVAPGDSPDFEGPQNGAGLITRLGDAERLAIADPRHAPAGQYARQALVSLGIWDALTPQIARTQTVRAALALVERGEAALAVVYRTDAKLSRSAKILFMLDAAGHKPIVYQAVRISDTDGPGADVMAFLASDSAKAIYRRYGFLVD